ncbi:zona pellucida glycoprotein 4 precursor [Xenopus tropicalis]|uniref:Zona pellucida sperm-binding protein 4 n=1 Tax=Xenopus tropicalis TaxID=8364 RepID=Q8AWX4_XENTR|nr:zona pellucida glycoprotein 4 precursor [Xenopus tropicalis]AAL86571.1 egg envelope component ZPB [Xenopus tropicalis]|eukprot:NP_988854.1 zona pellucida glycoprotein 4 precursor [Xenopus tropicalis]
MRWFAGTWVLVVALGICTLVSCVQGFWDGLRCGPTNMQFSVPSQVPDAGFALSAVDHTGKPHYLGNDTACGTLVGQKPDGSLVVDATYDGCYVREENGDHVMTVSFEEVINGRVNYHKQELKCPVMEAKDVPSPDACSAIQRVDRLSCAKAPVSQDLCQGLGCCYTPSDPTMPCYYGNKLTAQCTTDNNMLIAISKDVTKPSLTLNSISVVGVDQTSCPSLSVSKTNAFIMFQFPLSCGATKRIDSNLITYESTVVSARDIRTWGGSSITRDSIMKLTVRCVYGRSGIAPLLKVEVHTLPPPPPISTPGPLALEMRIARDMQYTSYYADGDYPVVKILRDPVYLEVRVLRRLDPNLVLVLNSCWATPSTDPMAQPQWPVLSSRCPFPGDNYATQMIPVGAATQAVPFPSHYQRFSISTFTFVDGTTQLPLGGMVYFHCSASVCVPSAADPCRVVCNTRKRRMAEESPAEYPMGTTVTSDGPVDFIDEEEKLTEREGVISFGHPALHWARGAAAIGGVVAVTITIIGLWIHYRNRSPKTHDVNA